MLRVIFFIPALIISLTLSCIWVGIIMGNDRTIEYMEKQYEERHQEILAGQKDDERIVRELIRKDTSPRVVVKAERKTIRPGVEVKTYRKVVLPSRADERIQMQIKEHVDECYWIAERSLDAKYRTQMLMHFPECWKYMTTLEYLQSRGERDPEWLKTWKSIHPGAIQFLKRMKPVDAKHGFK